MVETNETEKQNRVRETIQMHGNDKELGDVYEDILYPKAPELAEALADTSILTQEEAHEFAYQFVAPTSEHPEEFVDREVDSDGAGIRINTPDPGPPAFQGREKVAEAIWIYELLDAYKFPDFPDTCDACGSDLPNFWVGVDDESEHGYLCPDCAGIEPSQVFPEDW